jgi:NADH:ubiquinone oxidoreductase subunit D
MIVLRTNAEVWQSISIIRQALEKMPEEISC